MEHMKYEKDLLESALYPSWKLAILKIEKGKKSRIRSYALVLFLPFRLFLWGCLGHTAEKGMT